MVKNKKLSDTLRKPDKENRQSHPLFSIGTIEKKIIKCFFKLEGKRFNIKAFSRDNNIPRSTVYDNLTKLCIKKLIKKEMITDTFGNYIITQKGLDYIEILGVGMGVGAQRTECRKESLSTHFLKYKLTISDKCLYSESKLKELLPEKIESNKLPNFTEYYVYFEDATIIIKLNSVIIHIHDIISNNVEDAHLLAFSKALKYTEKLRNLGLYTDNIQLPQAHYARVESYLSQKLKQIDDKYFIMLPDGNKFWIDYSGKREDETTSSHYRERVDAVFDSLYHTKSTFKDVDVAISDLDKMKGLIELQIKLETLRMSNSNLDPPETSRDQKPLTGYIQ